MDASAVGFMAYNERYNAYDRARFAVLPVPYDATTSYQPGTRKGPEAIIAASQHLEEFDEELEREFHKAGIATLQPVEPHAAGPEQMHEEIYKAARRVVRDGKFLIGLGGEHSITSALVRAVKSKYKKLSVLQIDAHADLRNEYHGTPFSHAAVMRRVVEYGCPIVPVGIRIISTEEHRYMKQQGIVPIQGRDCAVDEDWIERALSGLTDDVYITIDIDGFDPAYAPGTGTPVPGGLDWYQATALLQLVAAEKNIVGADVVEVTPLPGQAVTEMLAARLVYKIICYVQAHAS